MSELIIQYVQKAVAAITPWLVGTAVGFFFLSSYSFTVRKTTHWWGEPTYDLVRIGFSCTIQDLYDFNFKDGALSKNAAGIQIGYGCGSNSRTHGQIYRHEIQINTTYENPFVR